MSALITLTREQLTLAERCLRIKWALQVQHNYDCGFTRRQANRLAWLRWCVQAGVRDDAAWWTWPRRAQAERDGG